MTPEQKHIFRLSLLRVLDRNRTRFGLGVPYIRTQMIEFGPVAAEADIEEQLDYLVSKSLVEEVNPVMSRDARVWRITRAGIAMVDESNLSTL